VLRRSDGEEAVARPRPIGAGQGAPPATDRIEPEKCSRRLLQLEIPWLQDFRVSGPSTYSRHASGPKTLQHRLSLKVFVGTLVNPWTV